MKFPVYKSLLKTKTALGVPIHILCALGVLFILLYMFFMTILVIVPIVFLLAFIKLISKKDNDFIDIFLLYLSKPNFYGF